MDLSLLFRDDELCQKNLSPHCSAAKNRHKHLSSSECDVKSRDGLIGIICAPVSKHMLVGTTDRHFTLRGSQLTSPSVYLYKPSTQFFIANLGLLKT